MPNRMVRSVAARNLSKDAEIEVGGGTLKVVKKDVKVKYTYLTFDDGSTERHSHDTLFQVVRYEPTPAEREVRDRETAIMWLVDTAKKMVKDHPVQLLRDLVNQYEADEHFGARVFDEWKGASFLEHQAKYGVWREISHTLIQLQKRWGNDQVTILSAVAVCIHERSKRSHELDSPMSRSTNQFTNMLKDLDDWAWSQLKTEMRYFATEEILAGEYRRLEEMRSRSE